MSQKRKACSEEGCTYPVWSKNKCRRHTAPKESKEETPRYEGMMGMFKDVWEERRHFCYECERYLGVTPKTYFFHHLLEKGKDKYKHLYNNKDNIVLLCSSCHNNIHKCTKVKQLTNETKERFFSSRI